MDHVRRNLLKVFKERSDSLDMKSASLAIGRNHAYLHQFIYKGSPKNLSPRDRHTLAQYLNIDEQMLTGYASTRDGLPFIGEDFVPIPVYDVAASAGHGSLISQEAIKYHLAFQRSWLARVTDAAVNELAIIHVEGDSMAPTLSDGDAVLVDLSQQQPKLDGIYVIGYEDHLMVKRLRIDPVRQMLAIMSDNALYPAVENIAPENLNVIGRVIWLGRRL
jgi:phage repressor protein C with HTH and peptisase S24 domain